MSLSSNGRSGSSYGGSRSRSSSRSARDAAGAAPGVGAARGAASRSRDDGGGRYSYNPEKAKANREKAENKDWTGTKLNLDRSLSPSSPDYNPSKMAAANAVQSAYADGAFNSGKITPEGFKKHYEKSVLNAYNNIRNKSGLNMVGSSLAGLAPSAGNVAVDAAVGLVGSNIGGILGSMRQNNMTEEEKAIQDYVDGQIKTDYDNAAWDHWSDYLRAGIRGGAAAATMGASELGAGFLNGAIDREQGLKAVAEKYGHIGGLAEQYAKDQAALKQAMKDRAAQRKADGDSGGKHRGILSSMQAQQSGSATGNHYSNTTTKSPYSYDLSFLKGLWDNLVVT